jgi:hypothetical protein
VIAVDYYVVEYRSGKAFRYRVEDVNGLIVQSGFRTLDEADTACNELSRRVRAKMRPIRKILKRGQPKRSRRSKTRPLQGGLPDTNRRRH